MAVNEKSLLTRIQEKYSNEAEQYLKMREIDERMMLNDRGIREMKKTKSQMKKLFYLVYGRGPQVIDGLESSELMEFIQGIAGK